VTSPSLDITASLAEQKASLPFTTDQAGKLLMPGRKPDARLLIFHRSFERCMGLEAGPGRIRERDGAVVRPVARGDPKAQGPLMARQR